MPQRPRKALIIGAGIAGPVAAILLKRAGFDAELFEAFPYSTGIGGGLQIAPNGMRVLAEAGVADELIRAARSARPSTSTRRPVPGSARSTATWRSVSASRR
jgi:2-polyprenyl-6-methoxyphenol hydroxylase-like FAD-dependent oxidoreductase